MNIIRDIIYLLGSTGGVCMGVKAIIEKSGFGFSGYMAVLLGLVFVVCGGMAFCSCVYSIIVEDILKK